MIAILIFISSRRKPSVFYAPYSMRSTITLCKDVFLQSGKFFCVQQWIIIYLRVPFRSVAWLRPLLKDFDTLEIMIWRPIWSKSAKKERAGDFAKKLQKIFYELPCIKVSETWEIKCHSDQALTRKSVSFISHRRTCIPLQLEKQSHKGRA